LGAKEGYETGNVEIRKTECIAWDWGKGVLKSLWVRVVINHEVLGISLVVVSRSINS
jgi:hypothetical protein